MTYIERGLYRELLDECWIEGSIPNEINELADICGCPSDVMANAWQTLSLCFVVDGDRLRNEKLETVRTEQDQKRVKNAENGRKGGIAKAASSLDIVANAKPLPSNRHIEEKRKEEREGEGEGETETEKKKPAKKAAQLPENFQPSQLHYNLALSLKVELSQEFAKFTDYYKAKGSTMKDWDAALRNWIRNAAEFKRSTPMTKQQRISAANRQALDEWLAETSEEGKS